MFEDNLRQLQQERRRFDENVQDNFGENVSDNILAEMELAERHLIEIDEESKATERRIRAKLEELRRIEYGILQHCTASGQRY